MSPRPTAIALMLATVLLGHGADAARAQDGTPDDISADRVYRAEIGREVMSAIGRGRRSNPADAEKRGMIETGLTAAFDARVRCYRVDDWWAMDYSTRRGRSGARHGGMDIAAPRGTPIRAVADGVVIGKFPNEDNAKGIEIMLRHRPEDTGLPYWVYTQYTHLIELPDLAIGARVKMGDVIGRTGNSGISGAAAKRRRGDGGDSGRRRKTTDRIRRDALHFAVLYSTSSKFMASARGIFPQDGYWMDPNALYRKTGPYDSPSLKALAEGDKRVPVPYMLPGGEKVPADTKLIWPYSCEPG